MSALLLILLSSVLVNVVVLASVPAWRPFVAVSGLFAGARALAIAYLIIVPLATVLCWLLARLLLEPLQLDYLRTPAFVATTLIVVSLAEAALHRRGTITPQRPGFALLTASSAIVLGTALIVDLRMHSFIDALLFGLGAAVALDALLLAFAALYERLRNVDVPAALSEAPLALMTAGIIALAFMGFTGLIQE